MKPSKGRNLGEKKSVRRISEDNRELSLSKGSKNWLKENFEHVKEMRTEPLCS